MPQGTELAPKPDDIPDWETLSANEKKVYSRQMEVFAAFTEHTDHEVGRLAVRAGLEFVLPLQRAGEIQERFSGAIGFRESSGMPCRRRWGCLGWGFWDWASRLGASAERAQLKFLSSGHSSARGRRGRRQTSTISSQLRHQ